MSKTRETIYIKPEDTGPRVWRSSQRNGDEISYVRGDIAYGYASEVQRLKALLKEYARHKSDCQRYGRLQCTCGFAETMARDALTKEV